MLNLSGNILYGTTERGGGLDNGTVFAVNADGTGFTNLHSFFGSADGDSIDAGVGLSGNMLYGTAVYGGIFENGTVFAVNTYGVGFTTLHSFSAYPASAPYTNSDGTSPTGGLVLSGNMLYGTAVYGGGFENGTVFAVNTNGSGFTNLHSFTTTSGSPATNSDGASPYESLILSGSTLYGMTPAGGNSGNGVVFRLNTDGSGFTNLHSFTALSNIINGTNSDGAQPVGGLILSGGTLYGTAFVGGSFQNGTVFAVSPDGTGFITLHSFATGSSLPNPTNSEGMQPLAGLIVLGNTLYGTTSLGGSAGYGTVFSLSLPSPPQLAINRSAENVVLTWPTNATGLTLQSATNLTSHVWTTVSPAPVIVNGRNTVTNSISGTQQFFRLTQ